MARKPATDARQADMTRLATKIAERRKSTQKTDGDPALRTLRKRLKRAQRRLRAVALRKAHAGGKKTEAKSAAATS